MRADELMTRQVLTLSPDTSIKAAAKLLTEHQIVSAPVVDGTGHLVGMVSEIDLLAHDVPPDPRAHCLPAKQEAVEPPRRVGDVMSTLVAVLPPTADAAAVLDRMIAQRIVCVPVTTPDGRVLGVISRRDLLRQLARPDERIAEDVRGAIVEILPASVASRVRVRVTEGIADIALDAPEKQRRAAQAVALSIPGIVRARVHTPAPEKPASR